MKKHRILQAVSICLIFVILFTSIQWFDTKTTTILEAEDDPLTYNVLEVVLAPQYQQLSYLSSETEPYSLDSLTLQELIDLKLEYDFFDINATYQSKFYTGDELEFTEEMKNQSTNEKQIGIFKYVGSSNSNYAIQYIDKITYEQNLYYKNELGDFLPLNDITQTGNIYYKDNADYILTDYMYSVKNVDGYEYYAYFIKQENGGWVFDEVTIGTNYVLTFDIDNTTENLIMPSTKYGWKKTTDIINDNNYNVWLNTPETFIIPSNEAEYQNITIKGLRPVFAYGNYIENGENSTVSYTNKNIFSTNLLNVVSDSIGTDNTEQPLRNFHYDCVSYDKLNTLSLVNYDLIYFNTLANDTNTLVSLWNKSGLPLEQQSELSIDLSSLIDIYTKVYNRELIVLFDDQHEFDESNMSYYDWLYYLCNVMYPNAFKKIMGTETDIATDINSIVSNTLNDFRTTHIPSIQEINQGTYENIAIDNYYSDSVLAEHNVFTYFADKTMGILQDICNKQTVISNTNTTSECFKDREETVTNISVLDALWTLINNPTVTQIPSDTMRILELEPCQSFLPDSYWSLRVLGLDPYFGGTVAVTQMSTKEFVGKSADISSLYDIIYFGTKTDLLPTTNDVFYADKGKQYIKLKKGESKTFNLYDFVYTNAKSIEITYVSVDKCTYYTTSCSGSTFTLTYKDDSYNANEFFGTITINWYDNSTSHKKTLDLYVTTDNISTPQLELDYGYNNLSYSKNECSYLFENNKPYVLDLSTIKNTNFDISKIEKNLYNSNILLDFVSIDNSSNANIKQDEENENIFYVYPIDDTLSIKQNSSLILNYNITLNLKDITGTQYKKCEENINGSYTLYTRKNLEYYDLVLFGKDEYGNAVYYVASFSSTNRPTENTLFTQTGWVNLDDKSYKNTDKKYSLLDYSNSVQKTYNIQYIYNFFEGAVNADLDFSITNNIFNTVYNDTNLNGKLYLHDGDYEYSSTTYYNITGWLNDYTDTKRGYYVRYGGNDILNKQVDEFKRFAENGHLIIFESTLLSDKHEINNSAFDINSNIYQIATWQTTLSNSYANKVAILRAFDNAIKFNMLSAPLPYIDKTLPSKGVQFSYADNKAIIGEGNTTTSKLYYQSIMDNLTFGKSSFSFDELGISTPNDYKTEDSKINHTEIFAIKDNTLNFNFTVEGGSAVQDSVLTIGLYIDMIADSVFDNTEQISDLTIIDMTNNSTVPSNGIIVGHTYQITRQLDDNFIGGIHWSLRLTNGNQVVSTIDGYSYVPSKSTEQKTTIKALQIMRNGGGTDGCFNMATLEKNCIGTKGYNSNTSKKFRQYLETVKNQGYNFNIVSIKESELNKCATNQDLSKLQIPYRYYETTETEDGNTLTSEKIEYLGADDIDMLIIGYGDFQEYITGNMALKLVADFIKAKKSILFTHDTSWYSGSNKNGEDKNYYLTRLFRTDMGQDRYGVAYQYKINDQKNIKNFPQNTMVTKYGIIGSQGDYTGFAQEALKKDFDISYSNEILGLNETSTRFKLYRNINTETKKITPVNRGQITSYPFYFEGPITVALTHAQYFQLNLEDPNMTVWYCLASETSSDTKNGEVHTWYNTNKNDARNNFYIYNNENITYSGVGHTDALTDDEIKLFINTLFSAFRPKAGTINLTVENETATTVDNTSYFYIDYDVTTPTELNDTNTVVDEETGKVYQKVIYKLTDQSIAINKHNYVKFYNEDGDIEEDIIKVYDLKAEPDKITGKIPTLPKTKIKDSTMDNKEISVYDLDDISEFYILVDIESLNKAGVETTDLDSFILTVTCKAYTTYGYLDEMNSKEHITYIVKRGLFNLH